MTVGTFRLPVRVGWSGAGAPGVNVWHFRCDDSLGTGLGSAFQAAVDAIHTFYSDLLNTTAATVTFDADAATNVADQTSHTISWTHLARGGSPYFGAPPVLAQCISWKTSIAARRGHGRTFFGPLATAQLQDDGSPLDAFQALVRTASQKLVDASTGANGWAVGVYGQQNQAPRGTTSAQRAALPHVFRDITGFTLRDQWAILRSRRG